MKLQKQLFKKYPRIFRQKDLPMSQTCMCWGIDTGNGWYRLLDELCHCIQTMIDNNRHMINYQLEATQVKEKYGTLRFYYQWYPIKDKSKYKPTAEDNERMMRELEGAVLFADHFSGSICEECGQPGETKTIYGWVYTRCKTHMDEIKKKKD